MIITRGLGTPQTLIIMGLGVVESSEPLMPVVGIRVFEVIPRNRIFDAVERG